MSYEQVRLMAAGLTAAPELVASFHVAADVLLERERGGIEPRTRGQQWIPVAERLPEPNRAVLVAIGGEVVLGQRLQYPSSSKVAWWVQLFAEGGARRKEPTHWMPLPDFPEAR